MPQKNLLISLNFVSIVIVIIGQMSTSANAFDGSSNNALSHLKFTTSSGKTLVQLNGTTKLIHSAEGGEVVASYSTMTPDNCSVSDDGVVTGLHGGTCSILASIAGSNSHSATTPTVIILSVADRIEDETRVDTPKRAANSMSIFRKNGEFIIGLNLDSTFRNKKVQLEIGLGNSAGKVSFRKAASLLLNSQGDGVTIRKATYAKNIYFRALVNNKVILTKKMV